MSDLEFKPEDFFYGRSDFPYQHAQMEWCQHATEIANAKLREWLARAPLVMGVCYPDEDEIYPSEWNVGPRFDGSDTHTAKLVCVEEIKK